MQYVIIFKCIGPSCLLVIMLVIPQIYIVEAAERKVIKFRTHYHLRCDTLSDPVLRNILSATTLQQYKSIQTVCLGGGLFI